MNMDEYFDYLAHQVRNREVFFLNFVSDFRTFGLVFDSLRRAWEPLGSKRGISGESHAGLLLFSNILIRHTLLGFQHITSYQSFLAWLTFRPGLEALLVIGKLVDSPKNAAIWKNRQNDWKKYSKTFSGSALESRSLPLSADFRQVLSRLNDDFMHPNPDFAYREATQKDEGKTVLLEIQFFDTDADVHEAHLLAYLNLLRLMAEASEALVGNLCGPSPLSQAARSGFSEREDIRAKQLADRNALAKKILEELGLWKF